MQPIVSYSYGARLFDRVKSAAKRLIAVSFAFEFVCAVAVMLFPASIAQLFTEDAQLVELVGEVAPVFIAGMSLMGLQLGMQSIFMGLGQAKLSLAVGDRAQNRLAHPACPRSAALRRRVGSLFCRAPIRCAFGRLLLDAVPCEYPVDLEREGA